MSVDILPPDQRHGFHGGLQMPGFKQISSETDIITLPIKGPLVLPVLQHVGDLATPVVSAGQTVSKGQVLAEPNAAAAMPLHAPCNGQIIAIEQRITPQSAGKVWPCILLQPEPGSLSDTSDTFSLPRLDLHQHSPDEIRLMVCAAGIAGLGGAVFPAAIKLADNVRTLIINGAECEPYISCDDRLMRERPEQVVQGAHLMAKALGAEKLVIAIENNKPESIAEIKAALEKYAGQWPDEHIHLQIIEDVYPSGGERQIIEVLTGKQVPSGKIPQDINIVVHNVATAAAVFRAVIWRQPLTSRIVTVTGQGVAKQGNVEVPLGTPIRELIEYFGGYTCEDYHLIMGGPMMGIILPDDSLPIVKASNCILVLPRLGRQQQPCIRCAACAEACPVQLLPQELYRFSRVANVAQLQQLHLLDCINCGACSYVCPSQIDLLDAFAQGRIAINQQAELNRQTEHTRMRVERRDARLLALQEARKKRLEQRKPRKPS